MNPVEYSKWKMYKGAAFQIQFRLKRAGDNIDPSNVIITISDKPGGTEKFKKEYAESPTAITIDDDGLWTMALTGDETETVDVGELYIQVDAVEDAQPERWITGTIRVYQNATA